MALGLGLLATLGVATNIWTACRMMFVLGVGLALLMQVLVLAVQNAVDYRDLGVATSGTTLFRSIGASVGVSCSARFSPRPSGQPCDRLPAGAAPRRHDPAAIQALPTPRRSLYPEAFTGALHPVFLPAAAGGAGLRLELVLEGRAAAWTGAW